MGNDEVQQLILPSSLRDKVLKGTEYQNSVAVLFTLFIPRCTSGSYAISCSECPTQ